MKWRLLTLFFSLLGHSWAEPENPIALIQALAAHAPAVAQPTLAHSALSFRLLDQYDRILPPNLAPERQQALGELLLSENASAAQKKAAAENLPPADGRLFDGNRLIGGNFQAIDHLIGLDGLPIGFDRQLPVLLIPLKAAEVALLREAAAKFQTHPETPMVAARTDRLHQAHLAPLLIEDGCLMRAYAGKLDDLYVRFFQNGDKAARLNFYALIETLPERTYHPTAGIGSVDAVPPTWFSLSDLLSGGGLAAVQTFRTEHPESRIRNPFWGIALRLLPLLNVQNLSPGSELLVPKEAMKQALANRQRFVAPTVPPLFQDPSRFLGYLQPDYIQAKGAPRLTREQIEKETPLPEALNETSANEAFNGPSYWENPAPNPLQPPPPSTSTQPAQPPPAQNPSAPPAAPKNFQLAVLTPTVAEAEQYIQHLAENDGALTVNARETNRTLCRMRWLNEVIASFPASADLDADPATLLRAASAQLALFHTQKASLDQQRLELLQQRSLLRRPLEEKLLNARLSAFKLLLVPSA